MEAGLSSIASLGLYLATRTPPAATPARAFRDVARLIEALDRGAVDTDDTVRIAGATTTVGRHLVAACLPASARAIADAPWDAGRGERALAKIVRELHVEIAGRCVDALETLGRRFAERSGLSVALDDFVPPAAIGRVVDVALAAAMALERDFCAGEISDAERLDCQLATWAEACARAQIAARAAAPAHDPLAACAASQRAPVAPEVLRAPRGTIEVPFGDTHVMNMTGTLGGGLGVHEYFVRAVEARHATCEAAARLDLARALFADLDAAIGEVEIVAHDCGTARGVRIEALVLDASGERALIDKLTGAVVAEAACDARGGVVAAAGAVLTPALAHQIAAARIAAVVVRDVRTCEAVGGVCARCFGLAPDDALWPSVGDPVGGRAAVAIAHAASQLAPRRFFHIC
jgi:DNA-directed RNA polymerase subunit beta'